MKKKAITGAAALVATIGGLGLVGPPASASSGYWDTGGDCVIFWWNSTSADYAYTYDVKDKCSKIGVRHSYTQGGEELWTQWYTKINNVYVQTPVVRELSGSIHLGVP